MSYKESDIVHEAAPYWVLRDIKFHAYTVLKSGTTCSEPDSSYPLNETGKGLAIARADYLSKHHK